MIQTTFTSSYAVARAGMIALSEGNRLVSRIASTEQRVNVLVVNAVNAADYIIDLDDGVNPADSASYTADGSATKTEIRDGLIAAVAALGLNIDAVAIDSDEFYLISTNAEAGFTYASSGDTPSDLTFAEVVAQEQHLAPGVFVCYDDMNGDRFCRLPRQSGDIGGATIGVTVEPHLEPDSEGWAPHSVVAIMEEGCIWMVCETDFTPASAVYVRYTASGDNLPGGLRTDDDTSKAAAFTRARFDNSGSAGDFAKVIVTR